MNDPTGFIEAWLGGGASRGHDPAILSAIEESAKVESLDESQLLKRLVSIAHEWQGRASSGGG